MILSQIYYGIFLLEKQKDRKYIKGGTIRNWSMAWKESASMLLMHSRANEEGIYRRS